jgi:hypothetical protein
MKWEGGIKKFPDTQRLKELFFHVTFLRKLSEDVFTTMRDTQKKSEIWETGVLV